MSAQFATLAGRRAAEALMVDACTITRSTATQTLDTASGEYVTTPAETVYAGPCRVKPSDNTDRVVDAGGQAVSLFPFVVSLPISAVQHEVDDVVTVTTSQLDPALAGLVLRVRQVLAGSHMTARRLGCERNAG